MRWCGLPCCCRYDSPAGQAPRAAPPSRRKTAFHFLRSHPKVLLPQFHPSPLNPLERLVFSRVPLFSGFTLPGSPGFLLFSLVPRPLSMLLLLRVCPPPINHLFDLLCPPPFPHAVRGTITLFPATHMFNFKSSILFFGTPSFSFLLFSFDFSPFLSEDVESLTFCLANPGHEVSREALLSLDFARKALNRQRPRIALGPPACRL